MRIYIDERERILYEKLLEIHSTMVGSPIQIIKKVLVLGDIVLEHSDGETALLIERKSIPDLLASIRDSRYEEQSYRLIHSSGVPRHNIMYLIEGIMNQVTNPKDRVLIYSSMTSLNHYKGFSIFRTASVQETAEWIWQTASKIYRNSLKHILPYQVPENTQISDVIERDDTSPPSYSTVVKKVKKDNITPENWMEIALCQIPGISSISAASIVLKFGTLENLIKSLKDDPNCLKGICTKSAAGERKLSSAVMASIHKYIGTNNI